MPFGTRPLLVVLALAAGALAPAPVQAQQPAPPDSVASPLVDSLQAALDRFEAASPPTAADSARLRRWADSVQVQGSGILKSEPTRARVLLQQSLRARRALEDSAGTSTAIRKIGVTFLHQSRYEEALVHLKESLEIGRRIGNRESIAEVLNNIGSIYWYQGRYEEAILRYRESMEIARELGDREGLANALGNIGLIHRSRGNYEKALAHLNESLEIDREVGDRAGIASSLNHIGLIRRNQGRYKEALSRHRESMEIAQEIGDREGLANALGNIGLIHRSQGNNEEALIQYRESLEILRGIEDRQGIANVLNNIGIIHYLRGSYEEALARYRESLEIKREIGDSAGTATTLNNIGVVHRTRRNYEEALIRYRESLEIARKFDNRAAIARAQTSIGNVHEYQDRYDQALARYRESLTINREIGDRKGVVLNLKNIGVSHLGRGHLPASADTLRFAVREAERLRLNATSPQARRSLLSTQIDAYQALTTAYIRAERPDSAFRSAERARARLLADRLAGTATSDTSFAIPSVSDLRQTLGPDEAALLYANAGTDGPLTVLAVTRDTTVARELPDSTARAAIAEAHPTQLNRLRRADGPLTTALGDKDSGANGTIPSLAETIRLYRHHLTHTDTDASVQHDLARRFHQLFVDPVKKQIAGKDEIIVVPTGALGYLPFETLRDSTGRYLVERKRVRYAQSLTVLRQLQQRAYAKRERRLLALGGAAYEPDPTMKSNTLVAEARGRSTHVATEEHASTLRRAADTRMEQGKSPRPTYVQLGYARWPDLPATKKEAKRLGKIAGAGSTVITGKNASEDTVRSMAQSETLDDYRRVHFATHGIAVPETPELSALVLSQVGASDSLAARDGYLTMREIPELDLRADVAVLSACQTGLGRIVAGEGVVSLSHAFLRAGANATLVSQWKVLDKSTRQFMTAVYKRVKAEGTSFAEAVTETKRAFIAGEHGKKNKDPLRWAPFVYYGRE